MGSPYYQAYIANRKQKDKRKEKQDTESLIINEELAPSSSSPPCQSPRRLFDYSDDKEADFDSEVSSRKRNNGRRGLRERQRLRYYSSDYFDDDEDNGEEDSDYENETIANLLPRKRPKKEEEEEPEDTREEEEEEEKSDNQGRRQEEEEGRISREGNKTAVEKAEEQPVEEVFSARYPMLKRCLNMSANMLMPCLIREGVRSMERSKLKQLESRWRKLHTEECQLILDQTQALLHALNSSPSHHRRHLQHPF